MALLDTGQLPRRSRPWTSRTKMAAPLYPWRHSSQYLLRSTGPNRFTDVRATSAHRRNVRAVATWRLMRLRGSPCGRSGLLRPDRDLSVRLYKLSPNVLLRTWSKSALSNYGYNTVRRRRPVEFSTVFLRSASSNSKPDLAHVRSWTTWRSAQIDAKQSKVDMSRL